MTIQRRNFYEDTMGKSKREFPKIELPNSNHPPRNPNPQSLDGFEYVPSLNLYVSKQKELHRKNWSDCQSILNERGDRMPTPLEFIEFLKHLRGKQDSDSREILNEIYEIRDPWRAEWLDGRFEVQNGKKMNYHEFDNSGRIVEKSVDLSGVLMQDKIPGVDINSWLANNQYGLPQAGIKSGDLYYWKPRNGTVARFCAYSVGAGLYCGGVPSNRSDGLGVRAVRRLAQKI